jgi:1-deoxy-D-xylulose-5-phosphate reductoisomerase
VKRLSILGSTGSIGLSTLQVVDAFDDRFRVVALAAGRNLDLLESQIERYRPELVAVGERATAEELRSRVGRRCEVVHGEEGRIAAATVPDADLLVAALVGAVGLRSTYAALDIGRDVALANKETLVVAGEQMTRRAAETGARILPVDSEHNALHQCLRGERPEEVRRLWLTASGGPFRGLTLGQLDDVTVEQALAHPTWKMGRKITIDSATLLNKGLEVIEAHWLFGVPAERISVVIHPQSVVHSMVEMVDGSFKAQLGVTDMRHPIQYALAYPERLESPLPPFDPVAAGPLDFEPPDDERFPCLGLAHRALLCGGAAPAVLNAANEIAVEAFLDGRARFRQIPAVIEGTLDRRSGEPSATLEDLLRADARARETAVELLEQGVRS